ncbi:unnamed protein product [Urochloa humidicola]
MQSATTSTTFQPACSSLAHVHQANLRQQVVPAGPPSRANKHLCDVKPSAMLMPEKLPGEQDLGSKQEEVLLV